MQFSTIGQWLLDGKSPHTGLTVTETRRIVKPGDRFTMAIGQVVIGKDHGRVIELVKTPVQALSKDRPVYAVYSASGARKWHVGQTLAIQPARGQAAIGRTPPIASITRQDVRDMTPEQAVASGFKSLEDYWYVWTAMHDRPLGFQRDWDLNLTKQHYGWFRRQPNQVITSLELLPELMHERPAERYNAWALIFEGGNDGGRN